MKERTFLTSNDYIKIFNAYLSGLSANNSGAYKHMKKAGTLLDSYISANNDKRKKHSLYKLQKFLRKQKENNKIRKVYNINSFEDEMSRLKSNFGYSSQAASDIERIVSKIRFDDSHPADALKYLFNEYRNQVDKERREKETKERRAAEKEEKAKQRRIEEAKVARQESVKQAAYQAQIEANRLRLENEREEEERLKKHAEYQKEHPSVAIKSGKFKFVSTVVELPNAKNDSYHVNEERAQKIDETVAKLAGSINMKKKDDVHKLRFALMGHTSDILVSNGRNVYRGIEDYLEIKERLLTNHDKLSLEAKDLMELSSKVIVALYDECLVRADLRGHREFQTYVNEFRAEELLKDYKNKYDKYYKRFRRSNASEKEEIARVLGDEGKILSPEQVVSEYKHKIVRRLCTREGSGYYEENYLENVDQKDYFDLFINAKDPVEMGFTSSYITRLLKDFTPEEVINVYNSFMGSVNKDWVIGSNHVHTDEEYKTYTERRDGILHAFAHAYASKVDIKFEDALKIVSGDVVTKTR